MINQKVATDFSEAASEQIYKPSSVPDKIRGAIIYLGLTLLSTSSNWAQ